MIGGLALNLFQSFLNTALAQGSKLLKTARKFAFSCKGEQQLSAPAGSNRFGLTNLAVGEWVLPGGSFFAAWMQGGS
jgi:hypothetical protein